MATVTLKSNVVNIKGEIPQAGQKAPDFSYVKADLSEARLSDSNGKVRVIIAVPSLDTGICAIETKAFNEKLAQKDNVLGLVISEDLPFAMKRFCETEGIENVISASDFREREFISKYNTEILDGPLKGVSARAVFVVDTEGMIRYSELVPEITHEPKYDDVMEAVNRLS